MAPRWLVGAVIKKNLKDRYLIAFLRTNERKKESPPTFFPFSLTLTSYDAQGGNSDAKVEVGEGPCSDPSRTRELSLP